MRDWRGFSNPSTAIAETLSPYPDLPTMEGKDVRPCLDNERYARDDLDRARGGEERDVLGDRPRAPARRPAPPARHRGCAALVADCADLMRHRNDCRSLHIAMAQPPMFRAIAAPSEISTQTSQRS